MATAREMVGECVTYNGKVHRVEYASRLDGTIGIRPEGGSCRDAFDVMPSEVKRYWPHVERDE